MDWTGEALTKLRKLWAEGLSTQQIANRMGITKNAVVGKAHRIGLSRPSPILVKRATVEPLRGTSKLGSRRGVRDSLAKLAAAKQPAPLSNGAHPATKGDHRHLALRPRNTLGASLLHAPAVPPGASPCPADTTARPILNHVQVEANACDGRESAEGLRRTGAGHSFDQECRWIIGDLKKGGRFCSAEIPEAERSHRRHYCQQHHQAGLNRFQAKPLVEEVTDAENQRLAVASRRRAATRAAL